MEYSIVYCILAFVASQASHRYSFRVTGLLYRQILCVFYCKFGGDGWIRTPDFLIVD